MSDHLKLTQAIESYRRLSQECWKTDAIESAARFKHYADGIEYAMSLLHNHGDGACDRQVDTLRRVLMARPGAEGLDPADVPKYLADRAATFADRHVDQIEELTPAEVADFLIFMAKPEWNPWDGHVENKFPATPAPQSPTGGGQP